MAVFQEYAPVLYAAGMATIPLARPGSVIKGEVQDGKEPLVAKFNTMKRRYPRKVIAKWCERFPDANVGYLPGLSRLIVVDDDGGAREAIESRFGKTPGMVSTRRGHHHLYRAPKSYAGASVNLKALGINADWKHRNDIVVGPGSVHKSGHVYAWAGCDERVLRELPEIDLRSLARPAELISQEELKARAGFRNASRGRGLNDHLCGRLDAGCSNNEAIGVAFVWNNRLPELGIHKLSDERVMQIAQDVWCDVQAGKVRPGHGGKDVLQDQGPEREITALIQINCKFAPHAYVLLQKLRAAHGARMKRGETFSITPKAMAAAQTIPGFTRYTIDICRDMLIEAGLILRTQTFKKDVRTAAQYKLAPYR